jgi:hypothetical protein
VVASVTRAREKPTAATLARRAAELEARLDAKIAESEAALERMPPAPSAAELRAELALLRRTLEMILLGVLVLVTIGLFVVLVVIGDDERVLARGVVGAIAVLGFATTVLTLQTLELVPRGRRRSH